MVIPDSGYVSCQACDSRYYVRYADLSYPNYCSDHRWPRYPKISEDEVIDAVDFLHNVNRVNFATLYGKSI